MAIFGIDQAGKSAGLDAANAVAKGIGEASEDIKETAQGLEATATQITDKGLAALGNVVSLAIGSFQQLEGASVKVTGVRVLIDITDPVFTFSLGQYKPENPPAGA